MKKLLSLFLCLGAVTVSPGADKAPPSPQAAAQSSAAAEKVKVADAPGKNILSTEVRPPQPDETVLDYISMIESICIEKHQRKLVMALDAESIWHYGPVMNQKATELFRSPGPLYRGRIDIEAQLTAFAGPVKGKIKVEAERIVIEARADAP
jgi:hypothetical protein